LSQTIGPVLDPVFSLQRRVRLEPKGSVRVAFVTGAAETREAALKIAERFRDPEAIDRAFDGAKNRCQDELREMSLTVDDVVLFNRLAASVVFANAQLRQPDAVAANRLGQPGLWPHGISGDLPIVLVQVKAAEDELLVRQLIQWRAYTRRRGMELDLVVLDQRAGEPSEQLGAALQSGIDSEILGKSGGIFVLSAEQIAADDAVLLIAAARAVLGGGRGSLATQLDRRFAVAPPEPQLSARSMATETAAQPPKPSEGLSFWNGIGGFTRDGREYVMVIDGAAPGGPALPPAPWTNVLANPGFGCLVTEGGLGYSWAGNSQMNRLTPWSNDPTSDSPGEVIYLRDEETGEVWTPTPLPRGPRAR
jgi:cellobiose phosphorylase